MKKFDLEKDFKWLNKPDEFTIENNRIQIVTRPYTDLWQRTYYGFRNDNAPALLAEIDGDFTLSVKVTFMPDRLYDQCGVLIYNDSENWLKISVEYDNPEFSRLGSVVTNLGYSDWATTDISSDTNEIWYRLSRRGQDFYVEYSLLNDKYKQMRLLHMHRAMNNLRAGVYACSPLNSSFKAIFSNISIEECLWKSSEEKENI